MRSAYAAVLRDRDMLLVYASAALGGGGRGLGVLNIFVPIYLTIGLGLDAGTVALMYAVLVVGSVPGPIVGGWLSDRIGRRSVIVGTYVAGAASLALFVLAGRDLPLLWLAIVALSAFSFVESPQLQALLADIAPRDVRDAAFASYFTLAFGVGSLWVVLYGAVIEALGEPTGLPLAFWLMALAYLAAAAVVVPVRVRQRVPEATADISHPA